MAANAKGKRRVKGTTLDLNSFLGNQNAAPGFVVVTQKRDWADYDEEDNEDKYPNYRKEEKIVLPTAPKAARGPDFDVSKIPSEPPFTAYIGNLPFDITEEEIMRFFGNLPTVSVRLPRDGGERGRMKGYGYAEFETKQALIEALSLNGESLKNRPVKVSLAGDNEGGRTERKSDGIDRTASDWRAAPKGEDSFTTRNQRNGGSYNRFEDSDRESYKGRSSFGDDRRYNNNEQSYQGRRSTERDREFSYGGSDRDRGYNRRYGEGGFDNFDRNRGYGNRERRDDYDNKRDDRDSGFSRPPRVERKDDLDQKHNGDLDKDRPKERMRLQLKPRTVPVSNAPVPPPAAASAIFGGAKPVDTAAKEREIEIRLAKEKEKFDDVGKPFNPPREPEVKSKADPIQKYPEESLKDKNDLEEGFCEKPIRDHSHTKLSEPSYYGEQENSEPLELLSNKFAHLQNDED